jgi:hypothetical protein
MERVRGTGPQAGFSRPFRRRGRRAPPRGPARAVTTYGVRPAPRAPPVSHSYPVHVRGSSLFASRARPCSRAVSPPGRYPVRIRDGGRIVFRQGATPPGGIPSTGAEVPIRRAPHFTTAVSPVPGSARAGTDVRTGIPEGARPVRSQAPGAPAGRSTPSGTRPGVGRRTGQRRGLVEPGVPGHAASAEYRTSASQASNRGLAFTRSSDRSGDRRETYGRRYGRRKERARIPGSEPDAQSVLLPRDSSPRAIGTPTPLVRLPWSALISLAPHPSCVRQLLRGNVSEPSRRAPDPESAPRHRPPADVRSLLDFARQDRRACGMRFPVDIRRRNPAVGNPPEPDRRNADSGCARHEARPGRKCRGESSRGIGGLGREDSGLR